MQSFPLHSKLLLYPAPVTPVSSVPPTLLNNNNNPLKQRYFLLSLNGMSE